MKLELRFFLFCSFLFGSCFSYAQQSKLDSLLFLLKAGKADTNRLSHLSKVSWEYVGTGLYDSALYYANTALQLGKELNKNNKIAVQRAVQVGEAAAYNTIGAIEFSQGNYPAALDNYFASLKLRQAANDKKGIAGSLGNIGSVYLYQGEYSKALKNQLEALKKYRETDDQKGISSAYSGIALVYYNLGNYPEALKNHFASLKIKEASGDKKGMAISYNNIGNLYSTMGNYEDALKNHFASLKIEELLGNKGGMAKSYNNLGTIYADLAEKETKEELKKKKLNEALKNYFLSLEIEEAAGDKHSIARTLHNIGSAYSSQQKYPEAMKIYSDALRIREAIGDMAGVSVSHCNIGYVLIRQKKYPDAEAHLLEGERTAKKIGYKEILVNIYINMSELYRERGNYKSALENERLYVLYKDSLSNEETQKKAIQTQMTYDFEKREAIASAEYKKELQNRQALADEKSRKQNIITLFVVCGLLLVIVFAGFILRSLRITRRQKEVIERQKNEVEQKKQEVEQQKNMVEEHQMEILDSIRYAKRIQQALLPSEKYITRNLKRLNGNS